jgi:hypothetical protein
VYHSVRAKGDTKTRRSRRLLKLPKQVTAALKAHHRRQAAERLQAGEAWQDHDLMFCRADGTPLDRWQVRREFAERPGWERTGPAGAAALVRVHPVRQRRAAGSL